MKKKIVFSLLILFFFYAIGIVFSTLYIQNTTAALERLIKLHQIEDLRQHLILSIQTVQSELYTVGTPLGHKLDMITDNVSHLDESAAKCTGCHHEPQIEKRLKETQKYIQDYQEALSYYITASANRESIDRLKLVAAGIGNTILATTEQMSLDASSKLALMTNEALARARLVRTALIITILFTFIFSLLIAFRLTKSITDPINVLVTATRAIASGNLDYLVSYQDKTEFGELAANFNIMSSALKEGYTELEQDIAERKKAEAALVKSEQRYALAAQGANDGLWDWDLTINRMYYSSRWKKMLGCADIDISNNPEEWFGRIHPDDRKKFDSQLAAHMLGNTPHFESEYRISHKDGSYLWVLSRGIAVRDSVGKAFRIAGSQTDITARKSAEEQLIYDAFHDALTGLPNRALFMDRLQQALLALETQSRRQRDHNFAVFFIDLDRFKVINDSLGHIIGDRLLVAVGQRLLNCLRPSDSVARLGGDEFAILLETANERKDFIDIAERIQADLPIPFLIDGHELITTASIGIAFGSGTYRHADEVIRDADIAMYQAKAKGKSKIEIFEEHMHASFIDKLQLEADLRMALDHQELRLHYQPILDMASHRLTGFEALVRWVHPTRGIIFPLEFIPLAEESGLILEIGEWILREACTQLFTWQKKYEASPSLKMSMNISGKQFASPALLDQIIRIVKDVGIEPGSLIIEITESIIMENADLALTTLQKLREMGIQLHIDDFGTGYSSLSYINVFPVSALKIDRSFIAKMSDSEESLEIIKAIITLAKNLNFEVIAEGLEEIGQVSKMKELNCDFAQGFYFSRPMDPEGIENWIRDKV